MSPYVGLTFDIIILVALAATMWRATQLSRQFEKMQSDRKAFEQLIGALNLASSRAEAAIRAIKDGAIETGGTLQDKVTRAKGMSEELEIMIQAGDSLAERLQVLAEKSRHNIASPASAAEDKEHEAPKGLQDHKLAAQPRSRAEKELLEALKAKQQT